jgi:3-hydroxy-9,10-secoandrosta-1,3,5(10)-triene-9,17-dione monooxygenase
MDMELAGRMRSTQAPISAEELLQRAHRLVPVLRERAARCEELRRVPDETMADYIELGLIRSTQPARYSGSEVGWDTLCEISQTLAAGCGSQAWIHRIMSDHAQMVATFPLEAQEDVWAKDHNALVSASFDPVGRAEPVEGGFIFSGRHGFASGIDHAHWLICGGFIVEDDRKNGPHFFLVPRVEAKIVDDWHTMGLAGTGSKSFELTRVFVPAHRFLDGRLATQGRGPGTAVNKALVYRMPRGSGVTTSGFASLAVGMAQGVLEEWLATTGPRKSRGIAVAERQTVQEIAARASGEIEAAEALFFNTLRGAMRQIEQGEALSPLDRARAKRNVSFAAQLCLKAGTRLFNAAGGRALFLSDALQRQYRNLLGAASHHALVWEAAAVEFGQLLLEQYGAEATNRNNQ